MTKSELLAKMQDAGAWLPGKTVKIDFGGDEGVILLDGANRWSATNDGAADTTIKVSWDDWQALAAGHARRHDRLHDRQAEGRRRHVQRDAAAERAGEAARLIRHCQRRRAIQSGRDVASLARDDEERSECRKSIPMPRPRSTGLLFDGMTIAAGGFGLCGIPERLIDAIVASRGQGPDHRLEQCRDRQ